MNRWTRRPDRIGLFASWNTLNRVFGTDDLSIYFDYIFFTGVTSDLTEEVCTPWNPRDRHLRHRRFRRHRAS